MKKKVSTLTLILCCFSVFIATHLINRFYCNKNTVNNEIIFQPCDNVMSQIRLKGYKLIQPLLLTDVYNESSSLNPLQTKVEQYINQIKSNQEVNEVSVYFRKLNGGAWFSINPNQFYNPASLSKLIELITYLKESEENPSILEKKIFFPEHFSNVREQNIKDFVLKEKTNYKVIDLLTYMIRNSDNDATILLNLNMNMRIYNQLFIDLNIPPPPPSGEYFISVADISKFFRVLFSGSYLSPQKSEFGLELLTESTFKDGLRNGVDPSILIAHKFGERIMGNEVQLHEYGIVYVKNNPYLIGVMTKGTSLIQLKKIIAEISRITFLEYNAMYPI